MTSYRLAPEEAFHLNVTGVMVILTDPSGLALPGESPVGTVGTPPPAPACVTVKGWPAMVIVPVRELVLLLAATE